MNENTIFEYENALGKITFAFDSPFWISSTDNLSGVDVIVFESQSTGQDGTSLSNQSVRPKDITIDGCIYDPLTFNRSKLIEIIAPKIPSTLTVIDNNESWYLNVIPTSTPNIEPGNGVQNFQFRLHAAYPYWRSSTAHSTGIIELISMFKFPHFTGGSWWISKCTDTFFKTITNKGNIPLEFKVVFAARSAVVNPELYHMETQKRILINRKMIAGEKIIVSTIYGEQGVTVISPDKTASNGYRYLSFGSDLEMNLIPGDNLLKADAAQNREGLSVWIEAPEGVKSGV